MALMSIDGTYVVFEGVHRLRWERRNVDHGRPHGLVVGSVWPDSWLLPSLRRNIEHGQRTLVVLDGQVPIVDVPRSTMPKVPAGAQLLRVSDDGSQTLYIPPFTWLRPTDRLRGETFMSCAKRTTCPSKGRFPPVECLIEDDLIGTSEPVRFVYDERPFTFDQLRHLIIHLYESTSNQNANQARHRRFGAKAA